MIGVSPLRPAHSRRSVRVRRSCVCLRIGEYVRLAAHGHARAQAAQVGYLTDMALGNVESRNCGASRGGGSGVRSERTEPTVSEVRPIATAYGDGEMLTAPR